MQSGGERGLELRTAALLISTNRAKLFFSVGVTNVESYQHFGKQLHMSHCRLHPTSIQSSLDLHSIEFHSNCSAVQNPIVRSHAFILIRPAPGVHIVIQSNPGVKLWFISQRVHFAPLFMGLDSSQVNVVLSTVILSLVPCFILFDQNILT